MLWVYLFSALGTFATDWQWQTITIRATQLWYISRWFCDSESKRKSNQRLNNIMVCWENEENNGRNGKNTRRKAEGTDRKREREWGNKSKYWKKGAGKAVCGFCKRKTKIAFRYIAYFRTRLLYIQPEYIFYMFFVFYSYANRSEFTHTHTHIQTIAAAETESRT